MLSIGIPEIDNKYEILDKMGEGGMGAIYKVRHRLLEETRVIKIIRPHLQADADLQKRFLREAQVAAKLRHSNIAAIHDFSMAEDGSGCIVMEFVEGKNLRQIQHSGRRLTVHEILEIAQQVLAALGYLHDRGFVHRDISTDNMMLHWDSQGEPVVKLIDLGLAKALEGEQWHTRTGMVVGKVRYISPEQLNLGMPGVEIDERCDLYSFGVVLYELLTNELPITGQDDMSLIAGHLHRAPRPFDETDPGDTVPRPLRDAVMKALEKEPDGRYRSAADFAAALHGVHDNHGTMRVRPSSDDEHTMVLDVDGTEAPTMHVPSADIRAAGRAEPRVTAIAPPPTPAAPKAEAPAAAPLPPPRGLPWVGLAAAAVALALVAWLAITRPWATHDDASTRAGTRGETSSSPRVNDLFFGNYHALVIGNDDYRHLPKLQTAVNDARAIGDVLEFQYGFDVTRLLDATRAQIVDTLFDYRQLGVRDNLLIYYAGHGAMHGDRENWQAIDAHPDSTIDWISTRGDIAAQLDQMQVKHVLVIADSCFAGAGGLGGDELTTEPAANRTEALQTLLERPSRLVLTSGGYAPVLDVGDGQHSVFAQALLGALRGNEQVVEIAKLFETFAPKVTEAARRHDEGIEQIPTLSVMPGSKDAGGQLVLKPAT